MEGGRMNGWKRRRKAEWEEEESVEEGRKM